MQQIEPCPMSLLSLFLRALDGGREAYKENSAFEIFRYGYFLFLCCWCCVAYVQPYEPVLPSSPEFCCSFINQSPREVHRMTEQIPPPPPPPVSSSIPLQSHPTPSNVVAVTENDIPAIAVTNAATSSDTANVTSSNITENSDRIVVNDIPMVRNVSMNMTTGSDDSNNNLAEESTAVCPKEDHTMMNMEPTGDTIRTPPLPPPPYQYHHPPDQNTDKYVPTPEVLQLWIEVGNHIDKSQTGKVDYTLIFSLFASTTGICVHSHTSLRCYR